MIKDTKRRTETEPAYIQHSQEKNSINRLSKLIKGSCNGIEIQKLFQNVCKSTSMVFCSEMKYNA